MADGSANEVLAAIEALRRDMQGQIDGLKAELAALKARPAAAPEAESEIAPEILVMLAAAATAYLGVKVRIRSARQLHPSHDGISPWAQHGRVFVQSASHNLRRVR
ncbi:MAG: hypothetical protein WCO00_13395 [Rhodospirillaceae bacterium]